MDTATVNGVELEYEVVGAGEPVLLISPVLADGFVPLIAEPALRRLPADPLPQARLGRQHPHARARERQRPRRRRRRAPRPPRRADRPRRRPLQRSGGRRSAGPGAPRDACATLALLELSLFSVPSGEAFFAQAGPAFEAYGSGDHEGALALFMSVVSGLDWADLSSRSSRSRCPGAVAQAVKDADTFFGVELPALGEWTFGAEQAAAIRQPVLSVLGGKTEPLWVEVVACRALLEERVPGSVDQAVKDVDTFFGVELPALSEWTFGAEQAAAIRQPVLSVLGSKTQPLWVEVAAFLRSSVPDVEECTIAGVGHLLHIQRPEPVARAIAAFLGRHPIADRLTPV